MSKVTCIGSGVIGTSWALNFAWKGHQVYVYDVSEEQIESSKAIFDKNLKFLISKEIVTESEAEEITKRILFTTDMELALSGTTFVQENGPEKENIKKSILASIEKYVGDDVIIASSTSGLLITDLAADLKHPERLVGGHPYNPPHLIPLVEIVKGQKTTEETAQAAYAFYKFIGKEPVIVNKEVSGFISNRLQVALFREAIDLVSNGVCSIEDVDKACLYGPGIRWGIMGPNLIFHLGGGTMGLGKFIEAQRDSVNLRLSTMATWKELPQEYIDKADAGISEEIDHREDYEGHTLEELIAYRDNMLIEMLKLHNKL